MASEVLTLSIVLAGINKYVSEARKVEKSTMSMSAAIDNIGNNQVSAANAVAAHQAELSKRMAAHSNAGVLLSQMQGKADVASTIAGAANTGVSSKEAEILAAKLAQRNIVENWRTAKAANSVAWQAANGNKNDTNWQAANAAMKTAKAQKDAHLELIKNLKAELALRQDILQKANAHVNSSNKNVTTQQRLVNAAKEAVDSQRLLLDESLKQEAHFKSTKGKMESFLANFGLSLSAVRGLLLGAAVAAFGMLYSASYKAALEFESYKKKLNNIFDGENGGDQAMKWVRAYALTGKATIAELTQALVTLGRLGVQPTEKLMENMNNVAILSGRNMGNIAQGIAFALKGSWWMMQRGLGIRKDDVMKLAPKAFDEKGKVIDREAALAGLEKVMSGSQYKGVSDRLASGMTGISRQISAYVKDTLATIGEIPKKSISQVLNILLEGAKIVMPLVALALTGITKGVSLLLSALVALTPVFKGVLFITAVWATFLGFSGLINTLSGLSKAIQVYKVALIGLNAVQKITAFWTMLINAVSNPANILVMGAAIVSVTALMTYGLPAAYAKMSAVFQKTQGSLGKIKGLVDDTATSISYMYEVLYKKTKEQVDKSEKFFDLMQDKYNTAIELAEKLNVSQSGIDTIKKQKLLDLTSKLAETEKDILATQQAVDKGGYPLKIEDQKKAIDAAQAAMDKAKKDFETSKLELAQANEAKSRIANYMNGTSEIKPRLRDWALSNEVTKFSEKAAKAAELLTSAKQKLESAKTGLIDTNEVPTQERLNELSKKRLAYMREIGSMIEKNNEKVHQEILGGGDLGRLGIAKYAIWKKFGNQFISSNKEGIDIRIKLESQVEAPFREMMNSVAKQVLGQYVEHFTRQAM